MTYATLQQEIAQDLNRQDLADVIPRFIRDGESRINKRIRHRRMETFVNLFFDASGGPFAAPVSTATLPDDWLEVKSVSVSNNNRLIYLERAQPDSAEWLFRHRPSQPQYYSVDGNVITARPFFVGEGSLVYYARIPSLSNDNPSNWLREHFPEVYRYAALIEGAIYLRDKALEESYLTRFEEAAVSVLTDHRLAQSTRGETVPPTPGAETRTIAGGA